MTMLIEPILAGFTIISLDLDSSGTIFSDMVASLYPGILRAKFAFGDGENFICNVVRNMICTYNT